MSGDVLNHHRYSDDGATLKAPIIGWLDTFRQPSEKVLRLVGLVNGKAIPIHASLRGKRVLVVDDNVTNCQILAHQMQSWGMKPVNVSSGSEALEVLSQEKSFDLVIVDKHMPEMDGLTLAEKSGDGERHAKWQGRVFSSREGKGKMKTYLLCGKSSNYLSSHQNFH